MVRRSDGVVEPEGGPARRCRGTREAETPGRDQAAFWSEQYALASQPPLWWLTARRLMQAAEVLWRVHDADLSKLREGQVEAHKLENLQLGLAWMLLTGLALENLVKAVLLKRKPELARPGRMPKWPGNGHDLPKLFDAAGVPLSASERGMLDRLTEFILWRGRYPVPHDVKRLEPRDEVPGGGTPYMMPANDHRLATQLFTRFTAILDVSSD